ncbi:T9SS type A sorting domain-containing protein [bacterium]|nr:T9SS type A sorting domain-containing protein [bacterium]
MTSEFDGRVALLTHDHIDVHPDDEGLIFSQTINDVWAYISLDGDFTDLLEVSSINITDLLDAETTEHPLPGHVYAYCDIDGVFDSDGNLHVVYTTTPYWPDYTLLDGEAADPDYFERWSWTGQVWHAMISAVDEEIDITHVAGYVGSNNEDDQAFASYFDSNPGSWNTFNDRPSLAIDPASNTLYCMWRSFTNLPDTSAIGYANADLFVRSSCDYGATWGPAVNITDSFTPECETGDCASEAWGTLAESVYDGLLHLEFVEDLDAGAGTLGEGEWTESPVWYLQVPVVDVPCGNAWNAGAHATQLVDTEWNWGALSDGTYEIVDFMHLLNEGAGTLTLQSIELLYDDILPDISIDQINGNLGDNIAPYQTAVFEYTWNAVIADDEQDAIIRFHTSGGTVDFKLANRNPLDFGTAQSFTWWEDVNPQSAAIPVTVSLAQNYPNPFNPTTTIEYSLSAPATVQLAIFNLLGEQVAILTEGLQAVGNHSVTFDGGDLTSGIYLYRLTSGEQNLTRKMVLVK